MDESTARTFRWGDLLHALPGLAADAPKILRGAVGTFTVRPRSRASIGLVFQQLAAAHPDRPFLRFEGESLTYGEANARVNRYAAVLAAHGVRGGDVVGVLSTNRPETLLVVLATVKLGAIAGMLNHNQRGQVLDSKVIVVGAECREALESLPAKETILCLPVGDTRIEGVPDLDALADTAHAGNPAECARVEARATAFHAFTSSATGVSAMSHLRWLKSMNWLGRLGVRLNPDDNLYCCLPLYHHNALTVSLSSVLAAGATLSLARSFSASQFWDDVIRNKATAFCYIDELCRDLLNQPVSDRDRRSRVRTIVGNGLHSDMWREFTARFGINRVAEFYGASECGVASVNAFNFEQTAGIFPLPHAVVAYDPVTGTPWHGPSGRVARVRAGEVGLLLAKATKDQTAGATKVITGAFRSGDAWFNTGDLVREQGFGHIAFVEVESAHPDVNSR